MSSALLGVTITLIGSKLYELLLKSLENLAGAVEMS